MKLGNFCLKWIAVNALGWLLALAIGGFLEKQGLSTGSVVYFVSITILILQIVMCLEIRSNWKYVIIFGMNALGMVTIVPLLAPVFTQLTSINGDLSMLLIYLLAFGFIYGLFTGAPLAVLIAKEISVADAIHRKHREVTAADDARQKRAAARNLRRSRLNMRRGDRLALEQQLRTLFQRKPRPDNFDEDMDSRTRPGPVELRDGDTYDHDIPSGIDPEPIRARINEYLVKPGSDLIEEG